MTDPARKPWWRRRRAVAAAAVLFVLSYPASFVPACRYLMRTSPASHPVGWAFVRHVHAPTARLLMACPEPVRQEASRVVGAVGPIRVEMLFRPDTIDTGVWIESPRVAGHRPEDSGRLFMSIRRVW